MQRRRHNSVLVTVPQNCLCCFLPFNLGLSLAAAGIMTGSGVLLIRTYK